MRTGAPNLREDSSTGYGLRFPAEIYGSKRENTLFHEYLQEACFIFTEISEHLQKPLGVYGNLGILYSSSLLQSGRFDYEET